MRCRLGTAKLYIRSAWRIPPHKPTSIAHHPVICNMHGAPNSEAMQGFSMCGWWRGWWALAYQRLLALNLQDEWSASFDCHNPGVCPTAINLESTVLDSSLAWCDTNGRRPGRIPKSWRWYLAWKKKHDTSRTTRLREDS